MIINNSFIIAMIFRPIEKAQRAGTAGFRAPEVLMRLQLQTQGYEINAVYQ